MKLEEAWLKILEMESSDRFKPNQILSILADLGVFKTNPRIRLVLKAGLSHNLWELVCKSNVSESDIMNFRAKLDYDGFAKEPIDTLVSSFLVSNNNQRNHSELSVSIEDCNKYKNKDYIITETSTVSEINTYLNSVFCIDYKSFNNNELVLQNIGKLKYEKQKGYYGGSFDSVDISYEITGSIPDKYAINMYVYDESGYLRDVKWIDSIFITNEYSIVNNSKSIRISVLPHKISRIVLRIDNNYSFSPLFNHPVHIVKRYEGTVIGKLTSTEIVDSQVLYEIAPQKGQLSFYIRFRVCTSIDIRRRYQSYYAIIYDRKGQIRQRCQLLSMGSMNSIDLYNQAIGKEFFFISENNTLYPNVLRIAFEDIGKIVIIDEL